MSHKLTKKTGAYIGLISLLGLFVAAFGIVSAIRQFYWPVAVMNLLYLSCFALLAAYVYSSAISSKVTFRSLMAAFCLSITLRDLVFPAEGLSEGLQAFTAFVAVAELSGLLILNSGWKYPVTVKTIIWAVFVEDCVIASIWTANVAVYGSGELSMSVPSAIIGLWVRPVIALCLVVAYLSRMKAKSIENE